MSGKTPGQTEKDMPEEGNTSHFHCHVNVNMSEGYEEGQDDGGQDEGFEAQDGGSEVSEEASVGRPVPASTMSMLLWSEEVRTGGRYSDIFVFVIVFAIVFVFPIVFVIAIVFVFVFAIGLVRSYHLITLSRFSNFSINVYEGGSGLLFTIGIIAFLYFFADVTPDPMNKNLLYLLAGFLWISVCVIGINMLMACYQHRDHENGEGDPLLENLQQPLPSYQSLFFEDQVIIIIIIVLIIIIPQTQTFLQRYAPKSPSPS